MAYLSLFGCLIVVCLFINCICACACERAYVSVYDLYYLPGTLVGLHNCILS